MTKTQKIQGDFRKDERGNALFLILIAVALFAALSYAVTQSGRGSGTIDKEQALISSSQITQFPAAVRTAVTRMVITGTDVTELDFVNDGTAADAEVFDTTGGGVVYQDPPGNIGGATAWTFLDALDATDGWYVTKIGSDANSVGREVLAVLNGVSLNICSSILKGLGLAATPRVEGTVVTFAAPTAATSGAAASAGTFFIWGDPLGANDPQPFACVRNGAAGNYVYYHALVEQ